LGLQPLVDGSGVCYIGCEKESPITIDIPADLEVSIRQKIESGRYHDATEVIRTALRLSDVREQRTEQLRAAIAEGLATIERGEGIELTPELLAEIDQEAEALAQRGHQPNPDVCPYIAAYPHPRRQNRSAGRARLHRPAMELGAATHLQAHSRRRL
jgi:putative addiction module CopG family antidote